MRVGVDLDGLGDPVLITTIVAQRGDQVGVVEGHGADFALLGEVGGQMTGDGGAGAIAGQHEFSTGRPRLDDACFEALHERRPLRVIEQAGVFGEVGLDVHATKQGAGSWELGARQRPVAAEQETGNEGPAFALRAYGVTGVRRQETNELPRKGATGRRLKT